MRRQLGVSGAGQWQCLWSGRTEGMAAVRGSGSRCGWRALCLLVTALCVVHHARAVEVYVPEEVSVENGTHVKLSCTFKSTEGTVTKVSATWSYTGEVSGSKKITIFHYATGTPYPGKFTHFKDRITWAGDLNKRDVSIKIDKIDFKDNGTYSCRVHNPPDIEGFDKDIKLRVVEKGNLPVSNVPFLVGIICAAIGGILLITIIVSAVVITRKKRSRKDYSGCSTTESLMSPVKQPPRKSPSNAEALVTNIPSGTVQGPVIYAQLDHSGQAGNQINKSETVVYADIRNNC